MARECARRGARVIVRNSFGRFNGPPYAEAGAQKRRSGRTSPHASGGPASCFYAAGPYASRHAAHGPHTANRGGYASSTSSRAPEQDRTTRHLSTNTSVLPWPLRHLTTHRHTICNPIPHLLHPTSPASRCSCISHTDHPTWKSILTQNTLNSAQCLAHRAPHHLTTHHHTSNIVHTTRNCFCSLLRAVAA